MVSDMTGLICTWAPIVTGTTTPTRITMAELTQTLDILIDVKKNHARTLSMSFGEAVDLFARGEVVTSVIGWDAMVGFAADKGKALDFVLPDEGAMTFMDTLAVPKGAPNRDLAYKLLAQSISAEGQKVIADQLTQAVITEAAVPLVSDKNRDIYQYGNLPALFERARFYQFWPLEAEGDFVTFDQVQEEYQRFLTA
jgi:spermidine/putrescine-binding protein